MEILIRVGITNKSTKIKILNCKVNLKKIGKNKKLNQVKIKKMRKKIKQTIGIKFINQLQEQHNKQETMHKMLISKV